MHDTAHIAGKHFAATYVPEGSVVVDIGGRNVNGSLREFFKNRTYPSVDVVVKPGDKLPFENDSVDVVISTSCFEHDPLFWVTFREISRVLKKGGHFYCNAPSNGPYHKYKGDNWRFYQDASQSLAYWSCQPFNDYPINPMKVSECFFFSPINDVWIDFICVWTRTDEIQTEVVLQIC